MESFTPEQLDTWVSVLAKPTAGLVLFIVLIIYKDFVSHLLKSIVDIIASWVKNNK